MDANDMVARNLRRFREDRRLSLAEIGRRAGLSKQTVASIESGEGNPTVDTIERLASALGVSIRALVSELGNEVLVQWRDAVPWRDDGTLQVRQLDHAFGSGYVTNSVLRLEANRGPSTRKPQGRGALRHCLVLEGRVRIGPASAPVMAQAGDFLRFPADAPHLFEAITPQATVFVCTTIPQLSMDGQSSTF
ncbi:MAG: helix-turn-helix domain-containing protein [Microbacterium sp.]|uniref:helix-turn-helix domain-containing protein n=1 Tax=Microbacterium sp. TaxID=51671 RepID=UPI003F7E32C8